MPIIARGGFANRIRHQDGMVGYDPDKPPPLPFKVPAPPRRHKDKKDECVCWIPFMWSTCGVTLGGIFIFALGCGLVVLGYYTEFLNEINRNGTQNLETSDGKSPGVGTPETPPPNHLRHQLVIAGPIVMGIGCFIVVVACTVVFEAREKALKQLSQEPKPDKKMTLYDNLVLKFNDDARKAKDKRRKSKVSLKSVSSRNSSVFSVQTGFQHISSILVNPWVLGINAEQVTKSAVNIQTLATPKKETRSGSAVFPFQENGQHNGNSLKNFGSPQFADKAKSAKRNMPLPILLPLYPPAICSGPNSPTSPVHDETQYEVKIMVHHHDTANQNDVVPAPEKTDVHSIHTSDQTSSEGSSIQNSSCNDTSNKSNLVHTQKVAGSPGKMLKSPVRSLERYVVADSLHPNEVPCNESEFTIDIPITAEPLSIDHEEDEEADYEVPKAPPGSPAVPRRLTSSTSCDDKNDDPAQLTRDTHSYLNAAFSDVDCDANYTDTMDIQSSDAKAESSGVDTALPSPTTQGHLV